MIQRMGAALAGGGAGLALTLGIVEAFAFGGPGLLGNPIGLIALVLFAGAVSGAGAGLVAGLVAPGAPGAVGTGAWCVWALTLWLTHPDPFGGPTELIVLLTSALLLGAGGAAAGWHVDRPLGRRWPAGGVPVASAVGALAGLAVLVFGVVSLAWAGHAGLRLTGGATNPEYPAYLLRMGALLWAGAALAGGVAFLLPVSWLRGGARRDLTAAVLGLVAFLVLGVLLAPALDFFAACRVGAPLPPLSWVTGGASC